MKRNDNTVHIIYANCKLRRSSWLCLDISSLLISNRKGHGALLFLNGIDFINHGNKKAICNICEVSCLVVLSAKETNGVIGVWNQWWLQNGTRIYHLRARQAV